MIDFLQGRPLPAVDAGTLGIRPEDLDLQAVFEMSSRPVVIPTQSSKSA